MSAHACTETFESFRVDYAWEDNGGACSFKSYDTDDETSGAQGNPVWHGYVKFDGCMNASTDDACMLHTCGADGVAAFTRMVQHVHRRCMELMGTADECYGADA